MTAESFSDTLLDQIVELIREMGTPAYLVGGTLRDELLKAQRVGATASSRPYDLDLAVPGDGLRFARRIADAFGGAYYPLDPERGVGRAVLTDDGGRVRDVDVSHFQGPDLMADLAGRDFTVNAMAWELTQDSSEVIDPHGGQADLQARQLRAVSDRSIRIDPVRGLRAVRLSAQLGFEIEPHTRRLIQDAAPDLAGVSAERVRDELAKILSLPSAADSLRQLDALSLLGEVLPEVTALKGLAQTGRHRWDAYEHTLRAVADLELLLPLDGTGLHPDVPYPERVADHLAVVLSGGHSRRLLLTLAATLHDVGKRDTATIDDEGRVRFINHEAVGATMAADMLGRTRFSTEAQRLVETIVRHHLRPLGLTWGGVPSKRAVHRFFRDTGDAGVEVALLSLADSRATVGYQDADDASRGADEYQPLLETVTALLDAYFNRQETVVAPPPLLTGRDLIDRFGLEEGPALGRLLAALREAQATGEVTDREQAEDWIRREIGELETGD
jgi:tRNA nucleotidyltransferase/poly(A) polymerase